MLIQNFLFEMKTHHCCYVYTWGPWISCSSVDEGKRRLSDADTYIHFQILITWPLNKQPQSQLPVVNVALITNSNLVSLDSNCTITITIVTSCHFLSYKCLNVQRPNYYVNDQRLGNWLQSRWSASCLQAHEVYAHNHMMHLFRHVSKDISDTEELIPQLNGDHSQK